MSDEYIIYCDESEKKGAYYSNFYGGAILHTRDFEKINKSLSDKKKELNLSKEVKWCRVTAQYINKYIELIDLFFDLVCDGQVKIRIMFTQNIILAENLSHYHREHEYFLLYYQFLKNAFGLQYSGTNSKKVRLYIDELPDTCKKVEKFKEYLHGLSKTLEFRNSRVMLPRDQITEVDSKGHLVLQCLDIILGSISFRLNNKHKEIPKDSKRRGSRTVAKESLYKHINQRIQGIFPKFNIGRTTGRGDKPENLWHHPYRHWCFIPREHSVDLSKGKKRAKK